MFILEQKDFRLVKAYARNEYFYVYKSMKTKPIIGESTNWPFHKTESDKNKFLNAMGITERKESFPYIKTAEEATILLVVAINEYNEKQT